MAKIICLNMQSGWQRILKCFAELLKRLPILCFKFAKAQAVFMLIYVRLIMRRVKWI